MTSPLCVQRKSNQHDQSDRQQLLYQPSPVEGQCILVRVEKIKFVQSKMIIFILLSIALAGLPVLILYWYPQLKTLFFYKHCKLSEATHFKIQNHDQTISIVPKQTKKYYQDENNSEELDVFYHRYIRYVIKDNVIKTATFNFQDKISRIMKDKDYHGLDQIQALSLKQCYGPGVMIIRKPSIFILFIKQIFRPLYLFMIFSICLWFYELYFSYTAIILLTSAGTIGITLYQFNELNKKIYQMAYYQTDINVLRQGKIIKRSSVDLVPGDVVFLKNQMKIPFEGIILEGSALINECALTGQSVPVVKKGEPQYLQNKQIDKNAYIYEGTLVVQVNYKKRIEHFQQYREQYGIPVCVIRTNFVTMKGQLIRLISFPKQRENKFQKQSSKFLLFLFCLVLITQLLLIIKEFEIVSTRDIIVKFLDLVTITVPPGLPISMTVGILYAIQKLKKQQIFCIATQKIINGGSIDYVCFDKTGTLTEDYMDFYSLIPSYEKQFCAPINQQLKQQFTIAQIKNKNPQMQRCLNNMATNHSVICLEQTGQLIGDPMQIKLLQFGEFTYSKQLGDANVIYSIQENYSSQHKKKLDVYRRFQFDSQLQRMGVVVQINEQGHFNAYFKGSPEIMSKILSKNTIPNDYNQILKKYASMGLRVLAIGSKKLQNTLNQVKLLSRQEIEQQLEFDGFQVFQNKLKVQTPGAIQQLFQAQIPCVMVTGDNALTASNIAYKCGISDLTKKTYIIDFDRNQQKFFEQEFAYEQFSSKETIRSRRLSQMNEQKIYQVQLADFQKSQIIQMKEQQEVEEQTNFFERMNKKASNMKYQFCVTGNAFNHLFSNQITQLTDPAAQFISHTRVYARFKPNDKAKIISLYQFLGKTTAMCGDGANDCGALKQADAGLSLSQAQASLSAPFTSKIPNITSMPILLRQCRAGLVTNFSLFNIMALYSLIQYSTAVISQFFYAYPADFQFLYWDLACNFFFFLTIGYTGTSTKLSISKPNLSLFTLSNLSYVVIMAFIQLIGQLCIIFAMSGVFAQSIDYYDVGSIVINKQKYQESSAFILDSPQSAGLFLFSNFMYIFSLLSFNISKPWRKQFYTNKPFMVVLAIVITYSAMIVIFPAVRLSIFNLHLLTSPKFNIFILGMGILFGVTLFICQKFLLQPFFAKIKIKYPEKKWI